MTSSSLTSNSTPCPHTSIHVQAIHTLNAPTPITPSFIPKPPITMPPFPAVTGGCFCGAVRYRLPTSPLFIFACHCSDCHKQSGSVYTVTLTIEADVLQSVGKEPPMISAMMAREVGAAEEKVADKTVPTVASTLQSPHSLPLPRVQASCARCGTRLWATNDALPVTLDVRVGTLDHPELMEPDVHSFVESKIPWVGIPEGARTCRGAFDWRAVWPKVSVKRLEAAVRRAGGGGDIGGDREDGEGETEAEEMDKTPTAGTPEEKLEEDEAFERRYRETEKALQERLAKLSLKLEEGREQREEMKGKGGVMSAVVEEKGA